MFVPFHYLENHSQCLSDTILHGFNYVDTIPNYWTVLSVFHPYANTESCHSFAKEKRNLLALLSELGQWEVFAAAAADWRRCQGLRVSVRAVTHFPTLTTVSPEFGGSQHLELPSLE